MIVLLLLALSQESDGDRLKKLEEKVQRQQEEMDEQRRKIDELERRTQPREGFGLKASFTEGFHLADDEGDFDLHLGGRLILHYRDVFDLPDVFSNGPGTPPSFFARSQPDTLYINSAYLIMEGTLFKDWGFRVTGEISTSTAGPNARSETSYVEWKRFAECSIRAGNFKAPMSADTIGSPLFLDEIERSIFALFVPNFELGAMVHGSLGEGLFTYQAAVTNGRSYLAGQGRARNDDDGQKEFVGRVTFAPFIRDPESFLQRLRVGFSGSVGSADDIPMQGNFNLASTELAVTWLIPNAGNFLDGRRVRGAAELAWSRGPASLRMEALYRSDEVSRPANTVDERLRIKAWYGQAGYVLTGENKLLDARIKPARPLGVDGGFGAVEVVARVGVASVERDTLLALATDLDGQTHRMGSVTVGLNWWPVQNVRVSFDAIREDYFSGIRFRPGEDRVDHLWGVLARFQVDF